MAFTIANWTCISASLSQGQETVDVYGVGNTVLNAPNIFMYGSPNDAAATIEASNYFLSQYASLSVGDWIMGFGTDTSFILQVTASTSTSVTVETVGFSSSVGTANIINNAVTYAKIQQTSVGHVLIGNPTGSAANVEEITLGNALAFSGTTLEVLPTVINFVAVPMTVTQWNAMYATPFEILAAPGSGLYYLVEKFAVDMTFAASQTGGTSGSFGLQYGSSAHLAGTAASAVEVNSDITSAAASTIFANPGLAGSTPLLNSAAVNAALYISNTDAAFTGGAANSFVVNVWYRTVTF